MRLPDQKDAAKSRLEALHALSLFSDCSRSSSSTSTAGPTR
jgi:hypothetical protein